MRSKQLQELEEILGLMDNEEREYYLALGRLQTEGRAPKKHKFQLIVGGLLNVNGNPLQSKLG
jgi:hypothetical protein